VIVKVRFMCHNTLVLQSKQQANLRTLRGAGRENTANLRG